MRTLTDKERKEILELYGKLRVADVRDGLDWCGFHGFGSVSPEIKPLWKTRVVGLAHTARYLPYRGPATLARGEEYSKWSDYYYNNICIYPWVQEIKPGDFCVIDQSCKATGLMGSANGLDCKVRGAVALATNGGARDTDELILEGVPIWSRFNSQPMVQERLQFDAFGIAINFEGVQVHEEDIVVADGDGMVIVPLEHFEEVARYANQELTGDLSVRTRLYQEAGLDQDGTILD